MTDIRVLRRDEYSDAEVWIGESFVGYRHYDGSDTQDIRREVNAALARVLLRELQGSDNSYKSRNWKQVKHSGDCEPERGPDYCVGHDPYADDD